MPKRKIELIRTPLVEADIYNCKIRVTTGGSTPSTEFICTGNLEVYCVVQLVKELRRALRKIRDAQTERLRKAVEDAEGDL